jgi:hypothetical protein
MAGRSCLRRCHQLNAVTTFDVFVYLDRVSRTDWSKQCTSLYSSLFMNIKSARVAGFLLHDCGWSLKMRQTTISQSGDIILRSPTKAERQTCLAQLLGSWPPVADTLQMCYTAGENW